MVAIQLETILFAEVEEPCRAVELQLGRTEEGRTRGEIKVNWLPNTT